MNDSFMTDRGTMFTKVSEDYVSKFRIDDLTQADGMFGKHLQGMYRFFGQNMQLVILRGLDDDLSAAKKRKEEIITQAELQYEEEVRVAVASRLPKAEGNPREPKIISINQDVIEASYPVKTFNEQPKEDVVEEVQATAPVDVEWTQ